MGLWGAASRTPPSHEGSGDETAGRRSRDEEVTVKHDNAFSENFDIVASTGCARTGPAIFTSTCALAWW